MSRRLRAIIATEREHNGNTAQLTKIDEQLNKIDLRIAKWLLATIVSFFATGIYGAATKVKLTDPAKLPVNVVAVGLFVIFVICAFVQLVLMAQRAKWERPIVRELLRARKKR